MSNNVFISYIFFSIPVVHRTVRDNARKLPNWLKKTLETRRGTDNFQRNGIKIAYERYDKSFINGASLKVFGTTGDIGDKWIPRKVVKGVYLNFSRGGSFLRNNAIMRARSVRLYGYRVKIFEKIAASLPAGDRKFCLANNFP